jgi:hypothetical protein
MTEEMAARISKCRYDRRLPSQGEKLWRLLTVALDMFDRNQQEDERERSQ